SVGITAPNTRAQAEVIAAAWASAQVDPADISYIEAHGTGTSLGDPIEIEGITNAFKRFTDKKQFCAISAIKPNLGHTLEVAGIFSFIKAVLSLQNKKILPSINFHEPNHRVDWESSAVYVNDKVQDWEKSSVPRLCGVSSFGLSGTNCHVVLSEAPTLPVLENKNSSLNIFTASAKNRQSFQSLVDSYINFISHDINIELSDLCYTANTGRGHYEERLAIVISSVSELLEKLKMFKKRSYRADETAGIFYNYHQIISQHKKAEKTNEISAVEIKRLGAEVAPYLKKISQQGILNDNFAKKICQSYVAGAKINWEKVYEKFSGRKISLPTYPFLAKRCWAEPGDQLQVENQIGSLRYLHPLLEKCLVKSSGQDIYVTLFSAKKHFVLGDHIINGSHVLPGTVYLEIAKQIGFLYYGEVPLEIKNLSFITPVITDKDEQKEVQIVVEDKGGYKKFFALSQRLTGAGQGQWLRHVEGEIHPRTDLVMKSADLSDIRERCQQKKIAIDINKNAAGFIDFGLRWQNYHFISFGKEEALAELELPRECVHDLETYYLHPPM
ncbi:MAG: polyketide synthase dehydratase domain-containing protein, partial [Candidatus Magasanikbacteria bacterium]|nr:polyketide synthase dehydratase domain-containing protein [Candidatus Magasanikbacteria bacterium]